MGFLGKRNLHLDYIRKGKCFGLFLNDDLLAGYCLVHEPLYQMYTIRQIPESEHQFDDEDPFNYVEVVGYFSFTKEYAAKMKRHFILQLLLHKASYIVYTYPTSDTESEACFRLGNPLRLYSGKLKKGDASVNVEVVTKLGILKICMYKVINSLVNKLKRI
jgi:hypothetical protein